jgi:hypothetical protein
MAEFSGALCIADDSETTDVTDHVDDASQEDVAYQDARWKRVAVKHERLHRALAEVVDDYGLLNCVTLDITSAESVGRLLAKIDKCNVYVFTESSSTRTIQSEDADRYEAMADIRERIASPVPFTLLDPNGIVRTHEQVHQLRAGNGWLWKRTGRQQVPARSRKRAQRRLVLQRQSAVTWPKPPIRHQYVPRAH